MREPQETKAKLWVSAPALIALFCTSHLQKTSCLTISLWMLPRRENQESPVLKERWVAARCFQCRLNHCGLASTLILPSFSVKTGNPGEAGSRGTEGSRGQPGVEGPAGTPGPRGMQGDRGLPGVRGSQGPAVGGSETPTIEIFKYLKAKSSCLSP